jgi:DNA (cytosine-5)-methyltransferase 1
MGYSRAGFDVVGVDNRPQPRYPFEFVQADAMTFPLDGFDAIHASPPCQAYSSAGKAASVTLSKVYPDLYVDIRDRLILTGRPWAIENVIGAPYRHGVMLCGSMFGLEVQRHRIFETSDLIMAGMHCRHSGRALTVTGHTPAWWDGGKRTSAGRDVGARAMGIDWAMTCRELSQAIPPAYTAFIGGQLREHMASIA